MQQNNIMQSNLKQDAKKYESFFDNPFFKNFTQSELKALQAPHFETIINNLQKLQNANYKSFFCCSILNKHMSAYSTNNQNFLNNNTESPTIIHHQIPHDAFYLFLPQQSIWHNHNNLNTKEEILQTNHTFLSNLISSLKPWRKGPFQLYFQTDSTNNKIERESKVTPFIFIDSEWQSNIKMQLILQALQTLNYDLKDKEILDVGCNNGYYMFDLALRGIKSITGIDPIPIFFLQFYFIYTLSSLQNCFFRLLGVQDLDKLHAKYDLILCMGVLYHRKEPLQTLKILKQSLKKDGTLILETLILNTDDHTCLCPYPTYAKMSNVFYIFSPKALKNLALHAGFKSCDLISFSYTDNNEQRTTDFIHTQSLGDFLDSQKTFEGYPPACRGIFALQL